MSQGLGELGFQSGLDPVKYFSSDPVERNPGKATPRKEQKATPQTPAGQSLRCDTTPLQRCRLPGRVRKITPSPLIHQPMSLPDLLQRSIVWLAWGGLGFGVLTVVAFLTGWGLRFRLVGVTSFTLLLAVSCWAFSVSYTPPVRIEGAVRVPVVFDNGDDLVVAQAPATMPIEAIEPTLAQLAANLRSNGRSSQSIVIRLRQLQAAGEGSSTPVLLGKVVVE
jgi:hypothetical protein